MDLSTTAAGTMSQMARGFGKLLDEVGKRGRAGGFLLGEFFDGLGEHVEDDAFVATSDQAAHHVGAHPAEADHSELHG